MIFKFPTSNGIEELQVPFEVKLGDPAIRERLWDFFRNSSVNLRTSTMIEYAEDQMKNPSERIPSIEEKELICENEQLKISIDSLRKEMELLKQKESASISISKDLYNSIVLAKFIDGKAIFEHQSCKKLSFYYEVQRKEDLYDSGRIKLDSPWS